MSIEEEFSKKVTLNTTSTNNTCNYNQDALTVKSDIIKLKGSSC